MGVYFAWWPAPRPPSAPWCHGVRVAPSGNVAAGRTAGHRHPTPARATCEGEALQHRQPEGARTAKEGRGGPSHPCSSPSSALLRAPSRSFALLRVPSRSFALKAVDLRRGRVKEAAARDRIGCAESQHEKSPRERTLVGFLERRA